ncbi:MAG: calcium/sodium antiporter [Candidatus Pacebacteria bacterium]|nr:calcium/sodium antiporter [Candidatus Paceibacterota bacterium]
MSLVGFSLLLLLSFYLLSEVCDKYFVGSLDRISDRLKLSSDVAGATFMAIGSSAPELFVAIIALIKPGDHAALGMGTIVGSAIFNILVIIGVSAVVKKAVLAWQPVIRDTVFYSVSIVMLLLAFRDGNIDMIEAIVFVVMYVVYIFLVIYWQKILPYKVKDAEKTIEEIEEPKTKKKKSFLNTLTFPFDYLLSKLFPKAKHFYAVFIISIAVIATLSWVLVESAVAMATILNIPAVIIALTVLAVGTSVPDLLSSVIVAKEDRGGMAISNAVGSNIFDILFGLGVPWLLYLIFSKNIISVSTENLFSSVVLLFATVIVILFLMVSQKWKLGKYSGYFLVFLYVVYLGFSIYFAYN